MITSLLDHLLRRAAVAAVARGDLRFVATQLPPLKGKALLNAVALQLTPLFTASKRHAFVYKTFPDGHLQAWLWPLVEGTSSAQLKQTWPEPLLEEPGDGLRLLRRQRGFEAQHWRDGKLQQSRWWPREPMASDWVLFVRSSGLDPDAHHLPAAESAASTGKPPSGWLRGDTLQATNAGAGWRWQAAALVLGCVVAAGVGMHVQTLQQLREDQALLDELRKNREAALSQRSRYQTLRADYDALSALAPSTSQLDLLNRFIATGVLQGVPQAAPAAAEASAPNSVAALPPSSPLLAPPPAPSLAEWDYRNEQLKLSMDIPEGQLVMLDITRRIEKLPGFTDVRIGLESTNTNLAMTLRIARPSRNSASP